MYTLLGKNMNKNLCYQNNKKKKSILEIGDNYYSITNKPFTTPCMGRVCPAAARSTVDREVSGSNPTLV